MASRPVLYVRYSFEMITAFFLSVSIVARHFDPWSTYAGGMRC